MATSARIPGHPRLCVQHGRRGRHAGLGQGEGHVLSDERDEGAQPTDRMGTWRRTSYERMSVRVERCADGRHPRCWTHVDTTCSRRSTTALPRMRAAPSLGCDLSMSSSVTWSIQANDTLSCLGVSCLWGAPSMILGPVLVAGFLQRHQAEPTWLQRFRSRKGVGWRGFALAK